jgi:hypothetical protein
MAIKTNHKLIWTIIGCIIVVLMYCIIAYVPQEITFSGKSCADALGRCTSGNCLGNETPDLLKSGKYAVIAECAAEQNCCVPHSVVQNERD